MLDVADWAVLVFLGVSTCSMAVSAWAFEKAHRCLAEACAALSFLELVQDHGGDVGRALSATRSRQHAHSERLRSYIDRATESAAGDEVFMRRLKDAATGGKL